MIDILLVLLIIFMVISLLGGRSVKVWGNMERRGVASLSET
jgi:biopolymer transport protein ExbD